MEIFGTLIPLAGGTGGWQPTLLSLLLAYVLSQAIAGTYFVSYRGLSYSRNMVQALVVAGIVAAMLMLAIGNSLARGIGIVGTLALIRFRTNLRDPLDMVFVFASFGAGIAAGTQSYAAACLGTGMFIVVVVGLKLTGFGTYEEFDGVVRLVLPASADAEKDLQKALRSVCYRYVLITLREVTQGSELEYAYHVTLKEDGDEPRLISALGAIEGARTVSLAMQEATVEL